MRMLIAGRGRSPYAECILTVRQARSTAEDALEKQVGSRPDIDCGTEVIDLVTGTVVPCILTDPTSGEQFDAPVTIEGVDGSNYTIGVQVADVPRG